MEGLAREKGLRPDALSTAELNELWDRAKQRRAAPSLGRGHCVIHWERAVFPRCHAKPN